MKWKIFIVCTLFVLAFYGIAFWMGVSNYKGIFYYPAAILLLILIFAGDFIDYSFIERIVTKFKGKGK